MKEIEVVRYVPDYEGKCLACDESPVVTGVDKDGNVVVAPGLCGPCTWGEAAAIDPSTW